MNTRTGRELVAIVGKTGYAQITIRPEGRRGRPRLVKVHRVVAEAWLGPAPSPRHVVNHKNGVKTDNRAENLEWVTPAENTRHAHRLGLMPSQKGEANPAARLTEEAVRRIRSLYQPRHPRYGARPLARELGVHHTTVLRAVTGEGWAHIPSQEESRGRTAA